MRQHRFFIWMLFLEKVNTRRWPRTSVVNYKESVWTCGFSYSFFIFSKILYLRFGLSSSLLISVFWFFSSAEKILSAFPTFFGVSHNFFGGFPPDFSFSPFLSSALKKFISLSVFFGASLNFIGGFPPDFSFSPFLSDAGKFFIGFPTFFGVSHNFFGDYSPISIRLTFLCFHLAPHLFHTPSHFIYPVCISSLFPFPSLLSIRYNGR